MKKQKIILTISVLLTFQAISQTSSDSITCIPNSQLKKAINLIERGKVMEQELALTKKNVSLLETNLATKDRIISEYAKKDTISANIINGYKLAVTNYQKSLANAEAQFQIQRMKLFRQKLKKWGTLAIGFGAGFLLFH
jgi:hypothetical protein